MSFKKSSALRRAIATFVMRWASFLVDWYGDICWLGWQCDQSPGDRAQWCFLTTTGSADRMFFCTPQPPVQLDVNDAQTVSDRFDAAKTIPTALLWSAVLFSIMACSMLER